MSDELKKEVKEQLKGLFSNPDVQKQVLNLVDDRRPQNWSNRSYPTYYKRVYAEQIQKDIEAMIASQESGNPQSLVFDYDTWCGPLTGGRKRERARMSENTLYLRINQSIRFLIERMDTTDHRYAKWNQGVTVTRSSDQNAVVISWSKEFLEATSGAPMAGRLVEPMAVKPKWERLVDDYIEDPNASEPLIIDNLALTTDEIDRLHQKLSRLEGLIMHDINGSTIRLIRIQG